MGEWVPIRLGDACSKIGSGATPRGGADVYLASGPYSLIRSQNVHNDAFRKDGLAFIGESHAKELAGVEVCNGDVLLNITGDSVARVCQVDPTVLPARVNQHVAIIRPRRDLLDARYLRYALVSQEMQSQLLSWAGAGATRNALTKAMIENTEIVAPEDVGEQRAIAHILGTLDDKIELNRRMNETLEAMARALFKSWFVDFDPVRAKAEGRDLPPLPLGEGRGEGLAKLFPDKLVESELGEIPEGWRVGTIADLAEIVGGSTPSTARNEFWEDGSHWWATPKDLAGLQTPVLLSTDRRITDAGLSQIGSGLLPKGTVLLSSRAPIGYLAIAEVPVAINQGFIAMKPKEPVSSTFLLYWARLAHEEIVSRANGSTFLEISKANFRPIPVVCPPDSVFVRFGQLMEPTYRAVVTNERQSRTLAQLRDALLPKLMSGEVGTPSPSDRKGSL